MITVIKKEVNVNKKEMKISKELLSKIKWGCMFSKVTPQIINGSLRIIKHTNLAYVEPHRVIINDKPGKNEKLPHTVFKQSLWTRVLAKNKRKKQKSKYSTSKKNSYNQLKKEQENLSKKVI